MSFPNNSLQIDPEATTQSIIQFISSTFHALNRKVAILGLSGGLDSSLAAMLAVKSLGPDKVRLYYLPERDSKPLHKKHARMMAELLGTKLEIVSITPALRVMKIYALLPLRFVPGQNLKSRFVNFGRKHLLEQSDREFLQIRLSGSGTSWIRRANAYISAKHRVRSVILYREAECLNGMVIGSANRTEWLTGSFTQFGCDHNADIMPLQHLYRTQLESLAAHLELPKEIRGKSADPDVLPGLDDKGGLLGTFRIADQILWGLENDWSAKDLAERFSKEQVEYIQILIKSSASYRETPYTY